MIESLIIGILGLILNLGGFVYLVKPEIFGQGEEKRTRLRGLMFFMIGAFFMAVAYWLKTNSR